MTDNKSIININLGDLSKPANTLIEKISDATGAYFKPYQIKRVAKAEVEAEKIRAEGQIEITDLNRRALTRFVSEESRKQLNMESIISKALPDLNEDAQPQDLDDDWIANFFDKCRLISDEDMQALWARILAGEANTPGAYSRRTVNFMGSLDKIDAMRFTRLCSFLCRLPERIPLIYDPEDDIYQHNGIGPGNLHHLEQIGLISIQWLQGYTSYVSADIVEVAYFGATVRLDLKHSPGRKTLSVGRVVLSQVGRELSTVVDAQPVDGFLDHLMRRWTDAGLSPFSTWPRKTA